MNISRQSHRLKCNYDVDASNYTNAILYVDCAFNVYVALQSMFKC